MWVDDGQQIGERALSLRKDLGLNQQEMADTLGLSLRGWQRIERGEGMPNGESLMAFKAIGINPGWILTGLGPKSLTEDESFLYRKDAIIDPDLLVDIKQTVANVHKAAGIKLRDEDLDRKAISHYNEYMASDTDLSDGEEMGLWLKLLEKRLRREVAAARAEPGTGKRSAS